TTTTSDTPVTATPSLKAGSVASATVHRIDTAVAEVTVKSEPLDTRCSSQSTMSVSGTIADPATPARIGQTSSACPPFEGSPDTKVFPRNICLPSLNINLPKSRLRIESTPQLALCIGLLRAAHLSPAVSADNSDATINSQDKAVDALNRQWIGATMQSPIEHQFILKLAPKLVAAFVKDANKNSMAIAEIVLLAQALDREHYRILRSCFVADFDRSCILGAELLQGLVHLVQSASPGFLDPDDLVKILAKLNTSLQGTHQQSSLHPFHLTLAVSLVLDVMADHKVQELNRVALHESLSVVLLGMRGSTDPYLMYQACYAFQALQCVPDDETALQFATLDRIRRRSHQEIPDIKMDVYRMVSRQQEYHWGQELSATVPVYIPPQAKATLEEPDTIHSPFMRQLNTNLQNKNRLNQPGRWNAKLIVSCRSQYLKNGYRHDFLPTPTRRSHRVTASDLFQKAAIVPFTDDLIEDYVKQFVELPDEKLLFNDRPQWNVDDYMKRLQKIPNLMDMVGNPFLLSVSLQVLHRIIGTNPDLRTVRVTSVQLYDIFVKEWVERGEKRLQACKAEESSTIEYSQFTYGGSWKAFSKKRGEQADFGNQPSSR
ncbi:hypothetical protein KVV02_005922, partial [Mortierella alpina]